MHLTVNGPGVTGNLEADATKIGTPFYLDGLQNGTYTVRFDLLDGKNAPVPGPLNSFTRSINITRDAAPAAAAPAPAAPH